jgi:serine/threonine-protein kinase
VLNPAVPIQIEQIVNRVMAKEPAARYRTAEQFGRALMDYRRMADQMTGLQSAAPIVTEPTTVPAHSIEPAAPQGTDWLAWILGALAVIAVIGLIPLGVLVARAYSQPVTPNTTPTPAAGPTVTGDATLPPFAEQVLVPNLLNRTRAEALQAVNAQNLQLVEGPARYDAQIPEGSVVAQEPSFGKKVPRGTVITVNLSQGPRISQMVNVLNFTYEEVISGLLTYGWDVHLMEQYNTDAVYHQILRQEPVAGLPLAAGQPVTLTVSGGTTLTLKVDLANLIWLDAADLPRDQIRRGQMIDLTLFWRAQKKINTPYAVFVHLLDNEDNLVQQIDTEPGAGTAPTPSWTPGITVTDRYEMEVPGNLPPGEYQLRVGLDPAGRPLDRLAVADPGEAEVENDSILIRRITLLP